MSNAFYFSTLIFGLIIGLFFAYGIPNFKRKENDIDVEPSEEITIVCDDSSTISNISVNGNKLNIIATNNSSIKNVTTKI